MAWSAGQRAELGLINFSPPRFSNGCCAPPPQRGMFDASRCAVRTWELINSGDFGPIKYADKFLDSRRPYFLIARRRRLLSSSQPTFVSTKLSMSTASAQCQNGIWWASSSTQMQILYRSSKRGRGWGNQLACFVFGGRPTG
jgi:hypothetical protein